MDLKAKLEEVIAEMRTPPAGIKKLAFGARLAGLVAELADEKQEVPAELFALFSNDERRAALMLFVATQAHSILE